LRTDGVRSDVTKLLVKKPGPFASTNLNGHFETVSDKLADSPWRKRNATLKAKRFFENGNMH
jgi:hypothetical protein